VPEDWVSAHPDAPFTFVTSGGAAEVVRRAVEAAGDRDVAVGPGEVAGAVLDAGLLDEVRINLVPLWLGAGKPLFGRPATVPATFGTPTVVEGDGVTHLTYRVPSGRA
jgi:dihydrofolate reductase